MQILSTLSKQQLNERSERCDRLTIKNVVAMRKASPARFAALQRRQDKLMSIWDGVIEEKSARLAASLTALAAD